MKNSLPQDDAFSTHGRLRLPVLPKFPRVIVDPDMLAQVHAVPRATSAAQIGSLAKSD